MTQYIFPIINNLYECHYNIVILYLVNTFTFSHFLLMILMYF